MVLGDFVVTIGRMPECTITLHDANVSRNHAEVRPSDDGYVVVDLGSTNDLDLERGNGKNWDAKKDFRVLWTSGLIPGSPMAYRKDLPDSLKKALKEAFVSFKDAEGLKKLKLKGYEAADDAAYNPIREQIEVKKQLEAKK